MRDLDPQLELDPSLPVSSRSVRVTVVSEETVHPLLDTTGDDWLTTLPHVVLREIVAFCLLVTGLALVSYLVDAPLLDIANPTQTPNPSKAPWYFLGIQELLHYYPPLLSGVLLPGLAVLALVVIPYFEINLEQSAFLAGSRLGLRLAGAWGVGLLALAVYFTSSSAGPVWPLIVTTLVILLAMSWPLLFGGRLRAAAWLASRSLPFWIFTWFVLSWVLLTVIGVAFRGPGWSFVLPWKEGIHG